MACLFAAVSLNANAFVVCVEDEPFLPLTNGHLSPPGSAQILMATAAKNLKIPLEIKIVPWKRCRALVVSGDYDAMLCAGYAGINFKNAVFPMLPGGSPDKAKAVGSVKTYLYRRKGGKADYVNGKFIGIASPLVGITSGYQTHIDAITQRGARFDDSAPSVEQQAKMLVAGRVDLVAGERAFARLLTKQYQEQLEQLPVPLIEPFYYLAFSKQYYPSHKEMVESLWNEIAKARKSAPYNNH